MDQAKEHPHSDEASPLQLEASDRPVYQAPPPFSPPMHALFVGRDGLRVPWRKLVYLTMAYTVFWILEGLLGLVPGLGWLRVMFCDKLILTLAAVLPALVMARLEQRPFACYGLPLRTGWTKRFCTGALWGAVAITVLLLVLRSLHVFYFGNLALHGTRIAKFAVFWGAFFLLVAFSEEFLLRGYTLFTLRQGIGFWPAAALLSIAFGVIHADNTGESWIGLVGAGVIGFFFCLTLRRTGDLWFAVGFHSSWDWAESYFYSVPDSGSTAPGHLLNSSLQGSPWLTGGSVGPEGSVLVFVLIAVVWVAFDRMYPEVKYKG